MLGLIYFLIAERRPDVFAITYAGCCIYFLPGLLGWVSDPTKLNHELISARTIPINDGTYLAMAIVLATTVIFASCNDYFTKAPSSCTFFSADNNQKLGVYALYISGCSFFMSLIVSGPVIFSANKADVLESLSRWHILATTSAIIAVAFTLGTNKKRYLLLVFLLIGFTVFIGNRSTLVFAIIIISLLRLRKVGKTRLLIDQPYYIVSGLLLTLALMMYKEIYTLVKTGNFADILAVVTNTDWAGRLSRQEPFVTQSILNEIILRDYFMGPSIVFQQIIQAFSIFGNSLGIGQTAYSAYIQNELFGRMEWGIANNIWAQMYCAGGFGFVFTFTICWNCVNSLLKYVIENSNSFNARVAASFAPPWIFYIHRNDMAYTLNIEKRVLLSLIGTLVLFSIIELFKNRDAFAKKSLLAPTIENKN